MKEGVEVIIDPVPFEKTESYSGKARVEGQEYPFEITQVHTEEPKHTELVITIDYEFQEEEKEREIKEIIKYHIAQHDIW